MADNDSCTEGDRYSTAVPPYAEPYPLKGSGGLDWGMQSRLARIFRPATSRTVMLAIDHGYFQGPTTERGRARVGQAAGGIRPVFNGNTWPQPAGG